MQTAEDIALCRDIAARYRAEADRLTEIATRPGNGAGVARVLAPLISAAEKSAAECDADADAGGWGKAWLPARLVTLLADLDCAETSAAIVEPLADDEPTRVHLAGLKAQADAALAEIADIVAVLPTYDAEWRHAAAERLMATRTGMTADYHERAAEILSNAKDRP